MPGRHAAVPVAARLRQRCEHPRDRRGDPPRPTPSRWQRRRRDRRRRPGRAHAGSHSVELGAADDATGARRARASPAAAAAAAGTGRRARPRPGADPRQPAGRDAARREAVLRRVATERRAVRPVLGRRRRDRHRVDEARGQCPGVVAAAGRRRVRAAARAAAAGSAGTAAAAAAAAAAGDRRRPRRSAGRGEGRARESAGRRGDLHGSHRRQADPLRHRPRGPAAGVPGPCPGRPRARRGVIRRVATAGYKRGGTVSFTSALAVITGANGSGKSTIGEAITFGLAGVVVGADWTKSRLARAALSGPTMYVELDTDAGTIRRRRVASGETLKQAEVTGPELAVTLDVDVFALSPSEQGNLLLGIDGADGIDAAIEAARAERNRLRTLSQRAEAARDAARKRG
ncbi:MAG: hypothetical protein EKK55_06685, partial [Rhodocyclaceae bacterium]